METQAVLFELFVLVVVFGILAFFILAFMKKNKIGINMNSSIEEVERFYYSPKSFLSIIKVGKEVFMVGVTENNINLLKQLGDKETIDEILLEFYKKKSRKNFSEYFKMDNANIDAIKNRLKQMRQTGNEKGD